MPKLSIEQIEKLCSKKTISKIAVQNFLTSIGDMSKTDSILNMRQDMRAYRWNAGTVNAIRKGIEQHFK